MKRIFVAGHNGMVGRAICRQLSLDSQIEIVTAPRQKLDLTIQRDVQQFFTQQQIDEVYLAAAKVGGIYANNTYPADFIYQNLMIELNVIHAAHLANVQKLLFLGSSCIYPKFAEQPIKEQALLTDTLEPTNEPYALAKIAGIKLCESYNRQYQRDYRSVMPTNLYGPFDNFHPEHSHVIPALIRRFHQAKIEQLPEVEAWGTGSPLREFLHVDDLARACILIQNLSVEDYQKVTTTTCSHINVGTGSDITIKELTELVAKTVGYRGKILWDTSKPDGTPRKLLDISRLQSLGWQPAINLEQGLADTYQWFLTHTDKRM
ncbi:GDP-L-fucose synthase [Psittacicella hinzii]|uniref:GDP-L-fucose synthase n=1 Tax=Psittacicella hinzii TaxID=2028575 RepID=A0A3A1YDF0_9GAMM|nr:GDP-L-fucose synthase [Psittacicella hinzii]RIY35705.1 GDP-fucose synthetase [Psittacicella hinzii]